jgi:WD40 repeat protein
MKFNAFISYSHAADGRMAPAVQSALENFAKPWYKLRNLNIFRDEASLSVTSELWSNIQNAIDDSEYLIYMASPESAASMWVNKEIEYWIENRSLEKLLIVLTDGEINWDYDKNCVVDSDQNSLPASLGRALSESPFYIDLRASKTQEDLSLKNSIFKKEILKLAAQLHNKAPKDMASQEVKAHNRMLRIRNGSILVLIIFLGISMYQTYAVKRQQKLAQANYLITKAQLEKDPNRSLDNSKQALELSNDPIIRDIAYDLYMKKGSYRTVPTQGKDYNYESIAFFPGDSLICTGIIEGNNESDNGVVWNLAGDLICSGSIQDMIDNFGEPIFGNSNNPKFSLKYVNDGLEVYDQQDSLQRRYSTKEIMGELKTTFISSDNKKIVTTWNDGSIHIWDINSGYNFNFQTGYQTDIHTYFKVGWFDFNHTANQFGAVAVSSDGNTILVESNKNEFQFWDVLDGGLVNSVVMTEEICDSDIDNFFFSEDGLEIILVGEQDAFKWIIESDSIIQMDQPTHFPQYSTINLFNDGGMYNPKYKVILDEISDLHRIHRISTSPNRSNAAVESTLRPADLGKMIIEFPEFIRTFQISPDEQWALLAEEKHLHLRKTNKGDSLLPIDLIERTFTPLDADSKVMGGFFSKNSKRMMFADLLMFDPNIDGIDEDLVGTFNYEIWDMESAKLMKRFSIPISTDSLIELLDKTRIGMLFSQDAERILLIIGNQLIIVRTPRSFEEVFK